MAEETQGASPELDAPVPPETQAADSSPAEPVNTPDDTGAAPPEGKPDSVQKRIDHLTWEKNQQAREAEYWRAQAYQAQRPVEPPPEPAKAVPPTLEEMGFDEAKYQAATLQYTTELARAEVRKELAAAESQRSEQARLETFATRQREFAKANPDFEAKVMRDMTLPITAAMREVIIDSPAGPEVAYYLANNRDQAAEISRLPPHLAALEIGRIEGRLSALKGVKTPRAPSVTQAPPPPSMIDTADAAVPIKASSGESDKLSDAEWMKAREKELKRKKG